MPRSAPAARLTVYLAGTAMWHHAPAYAEIVHRARRAGLSGASVFHGVEGFTAGGPVLHERPAHLRRVGPCAVVIVDDEQRLRDFLADTAPVLDAVARLMVMDRVRIHRPAVDGGR